jgi:hypothetical protein
MNINFRKFVLVPLLLVAGVSTAATFATVYLTDTGFAATKKPVAKNAATPKAQTTFPPLSSQLPPDIPVPGGAQNATITDAAVFAWQEFIALNWPAAVAPQYTSANQRGVPNSALKFGDDISGSNPSKQPVVWETYRGKVETFPGTGTPTGYPGQGNSNNYGFSAGPAYVYSTASSTNPTGYPSGLVPACDSSQSGDAVPWVNLDETSQIGLDFMFSGIPAAAPQNDNDQPQLIRFLAKGNGTFYNYVSTYQLWLQGAGTNFTNAQTAFANAAAANTYSAAVDNTFPPNPLPSTPPSVLSLPAGTVLVKAAWRELTSSDDPSKFHVKTVRYYEASSPGSKTACYRDKMWGLMALHIIQKTPTAPYFIFATFEQASNIVNTNGSPVENANGAEINVPMTTAISPQVNYYDALYNANGQNLPPGKYYSPRYPAGQTPPPTPPGNATGMKDPNFPYAQLNPGDAFCAVGGGTTPAANARLYYRNSFQGLPPPNAQPYSPNPNEGICVNKRYFPIPSQIIAVNAAAHTAVANYGAKGPWQYYKLVNVQWQPFEAANIDITGANSSRLAATYYLSNSVVETDTTLQQFFGALSYNGVKTGFETPSSSPNNEVSTSMPAHNIYLSPGTGTPSNQFTRYSMGGCMGCHGRAERAGSDFSFTLNEGPVAGPDFATLPSSVALTAGVPPKAHSQPGVDQARIDAIRKALIGTQ